MLILGCVKDPRDVPTVLGQRDIVQTRLTGGDGSGQRAKTHIDR